MTTMLDSGGDAVAGTATRRPVITAADRTEQADLLDAVSRTFALTIPHLPPTLRDVTSHAYLLCRVVDTIEDETRTALTTKRALYERFPRVLQGDGAADALSRDIAAVLQPETPPGERRLIRALPHLVRVHGTLSPAEHRALTRCLRIMSDGMLRYENVERDIAGPRGVADIESLETYCYHVAGVVGEMLTELFCEHLPGLEQRRDTMLRLSVSFGAGLQLTNILKDIAVDFRRGVCWLPRELFDGNLDELERAALSGQTPSDSVARAFDEGVQRLVGLGRQRLDEARQYVLLLPPEAIGIRRFCLWSIAMALLTLRKIHRGGHQLRDQKSVKIHRRSVRAALLLSHVGARSDRLLNLMFDLATVGMPASDHVSTRRLGSWT